MITGAIFDADGTLLDSMSIWDGVGTRYLMSLNIKPEDNLSDTLSTMSLEEGYSYLKNTYNLKFSTEQIKSSILEIVSNFYINEVNAKNGIDNILKKLFNQKVPMIVATTGDTLLVTKALKRLDLLKYFQEVLSCNDYNTSKREYEIYNISAKKINSEPNKTLVFEDALYAIKSAKKANFIVVGVEDSSNAQDKEQIILQSDYYTTDFTDLNF